ncbi:hypothetical protein F2Q69_00043790 [Brassica cretica]|uniref:Uncharacterized protein n=1 Tax=Brassica cretica TaxID=69181 RepID=A0A8S9NJD2_BRACR|nr:hypothetical protein F2Q69_00043790 [Brassica cretica]
MSEGEMKPTPEKHESRLETINNLPNLQSILGGEHYPNLEWQTWRKRESHRDASRVERCNEMKEHRWKGRQNEIIKSWSRPRAIDV